MDAVDDVITAVDSFYAVIALLIIGSYALAWRFGGEMLQLLRDNSRRHDETDEKIKKVTETTAAVKEVTEHVAFSIKTNHESKNIGDAMDRLYEILLDVSQSALVANDRMARLEKRQLENNVAVGKHADIISDFDSRLDEHIRETEALVQEGRELIPLVRKAMRSGE